MIYEYKGKVFLTIDEVNEEIDSSVGSNFNDAPPDYVYEDEWNYHVEKIELTHLPQEEQWSYFKDWCKQNDIQEKQRDSLTMFLEGNKND